MDDFAIPLRSLRLPAGRPQGPGLLDPDALDLVAEIRSLLVESFALLEEARAIEESNAPFQPLADRLTAGIQEADRLAESE